MKYADAALQKGTFQEQWKIWAGLECEGPYTNLWTCFVGSHCSIEEFLSFPIEQYEQVYINPGFLQKVYKFKVFKKKLKDYQRKVTLAVFIEDYQEVINCYPDYHIMVIYPQVSLRPQDTIRLDCGDMQTYSIAIKDLIKTTEKNYINDRRLL